MGITVLSLFDGISCGMVALERAGIEVDKYIAYEIEHNAIEISKKNYPEIVRGGGGRNKGRFYKVQRKNRYFNWWQPMPEPLQLRK